MCLLVSHCFFLCSRLRYSASWLHVLKLQLCMLAHCDSTDLYTESVYRIINCVWEEREGEGEGERERERERKREREREREMAH